MTMGSRGSLQTRFFPFCSVLVSLWGCFLLAGLSLRVPGCHGAILAFLSVVVFGPTGPGKMSSYMYDLGAWHGGPGSQCLWAALGDAKEHELFSCRERAEVGGPW